MVAKNDLEESESFDLEFEIVGKVTGVKINDFQIITVKEQMKEFEVSFESFGSGACILIDFKDGVVKTFGDETFCNEWKPDVMYDPTFQSLTAPQQLFYTYL